MSTRSPGKTKPATPLVVVDGDGDGAHAGAERSGEEAAVLRSDERAAGEGLAGGDRIAHHRAKKLDGSESGAPWCNNAGCTESFGHG
jgi:hypothetical protein